MSQPSMIVTPLGIVETDGYAGKCNCSGTTNLKYRKGKYLIYFQPKRRVYHIKENGSYIEQNKPINELCQKLKSLGFPVCAESSGQN